MAANKGRPPRYMGGQAVVEGVMMRGEDRWAVAVRSPEGTIEVETHPVPRWAERVAFGIGDLLAGRLLVVDHASATTRTVNLPRNPDCPACGQRNLEFLHAETGTRTATLCGRNAVQISVAGRPAVDLAELAGRLRNSGVADVAVNPYLLRAAIDDLELTVFADARAIIKGTEDERVARTVYARYVGM